jgi:hypothetical protein
MRGITCSSQCRLTLHMLAAKATAFNQQSHLQQRLQQQLLQTAAVASYSNLTGAGAAVAAVAAVSQKQ